MTDVEAALAHYRTHGWARLGKVVDDAHLDELRARTVALMLGEVRRPGMFFQHDSDTGRYEDLPYGEGWVGPSLGYRKLEKLELDDVFLRLVEHPVHRVVAQAVLGPEVTLYRAAMFAKQPRVGSPTPFHQDGGSYWGLDREPELQIWTALDDAPAASGCVEVVSGSHARGLVTPLGGVIPAAAVDAHGAVQRAVRLPAVAGESLLFHNHLWHRSGPNLTEHPRRAVTSCYLHAATRCLRKKRAPRVFPPVFR